jgi:hypothetical protein
VRLLYQQNELNETLSLKLNYVSSEELNDTVKLASEDSASLNYKTNFLYS